MGDGCVMGEGVGERNYNTAEACVLILYVLD